MKQTKLTGWRKPGAYGYSLRDHLIRGGVFLALSYVGLLLFAIALLLLFPFGAD